jgi:hypothetical protein
MTIPPTLGERTGQMWTPAASLGTILEFYLPCGLDGGCVPCMPTSIPTAIN